MTVSSKHQRTNVPSHGLVQNCVVVSAKGVHRKRRSDATLRECHCLRQRTPACVIQTILTGVSDERPRELIVRTSYCTMLQTGFKPCPRLGKSVCRSFRTCHLKS